MFPSFKLFNYISSGIMSTTPVREKIFRRKNAKALKREYKFCPNVFSELEPKGKKFKEVSCPEPRSGHRIVAKDGNIYVFGGYNSVPNEVLNNHLLYKELWRYNCASRTWKLLETNGVMPEELASHCAMLVNNHLVVYGGTGFPFGESSSNSTHICDLKELKWSKLDTTGSAPVKQYGQAMTICDSKLYVVGGTTGFTYSMRVHCLDLKTRKWQLLKSDTQRYNLYEPEPRYRHEIALYDNKIFVFGGGTADEAFDLKNIPVFNLDTCLWSRIETTSECPEPRRCHDSVQMDDDVYICGGTDGTTIFSDVWKFNLPSLQWKKMNIKLVLPVYFHSATLSDSGQLFIFGGVNSIEENLRNNKFFTMWLKVPTLADMCWQAALHYMPHMSQLDKSSLFRAGIPLKYIEEVDFESEATSSSSSCCNRLVEQR